MSNTGQLYLVSAGIGDPDNMTIRAHRIIKSADIVLAMDLVSKPLADLLDGKELHNAGHGLFTGVNVNSGGPKAEDKIRKIIRTGYSEGKTIAVLDFGDPTVYSPQSAYLREFSDLNPKVIPGISSFNAANAVLGRELTGNYDRAVILTEAMKGWDGARERLQKLAATQSTLVFFSMRLDLKEVVSDLKEHYPSDTPIAIVLNAGFAEKEGTIRGTLDTIIEISNDKTLPWQHLIYVGDFLN